jgi:hypothetical protein
MIIVRFEVSTSVTMKNAFLWTRDGVGFVTTNVLEERITSIFRAERIKELATTLAVTSN